MEKRRLKGLRLAGSIIAAAAGTGILGSIVAFMTYFALYGNRGSLQVYLPESIGMRNADLSSGRYPEVLIDILITNTGAPRVWRYIRSVRGEVLQPIGDMSKLTHPLQWRTFEEYISCKAYLKQYPEETCKQLDVLVYQSAARSYAIAGQQSESRLIRMSGLPSQPLLPYPDLPFRLRVVIETDRGLKTLEEDYESCDVRPTGDNFTYCWRRKSTPA